MAKKKEFPEGKFPIELNIVAHNAVFLNFWDYAHGNDVIVEVIDGKLLQEQESGPPKEISFKEFIVQVIESIQKRTV